MQMTLTIDGILEDFCRWLDDEESMLSLPDFQTCLAESSERLPDHYCDEIGIPIGSTVGHAIRSMIPFFIDGQEHRFGTTMNFRSEEDSLHWWRATDGMQRWSIEFSPSKGMWRLEIAAAPETSHHWIKEGL